MKDATEHRIQCEVEKSRMTDWWYHLKSFILRRHYCRLIPQGGLATHGGHVLVVECIFDNDNNVLVAELGLRVHHPLEKFYLRKPEPITFAAKIVGGRYVRIG